jgi:hypothetical protein
MKFPKALPSYPIRRVHQWMAPFLLGMILVMLPLQAAAQSAVAVTIDAPGGRFVAHPTTPAFGAGESYDLAMGDINGDGQVDALIGTAAGVTVWLGDGTGNFTPHPTAPLFASDAWINTVLLGDIDGDGDLDVIIHAEDHDYNQLVWVNDGAGVFTPHPTSSFVPPRSSLEGFGLILADVDDDGDLDLITGPDIVTRGTVWLNDGAGNFSVHPTTPTFGSEQISYGMAVGDINGNGRLDLVYGTRFDIRIFANNGSGGFTAHPTIPILAQPGPQAYNRGVVLGDIDGDGDLDLVVARDALNPDLRIAQEVWVNDGTGAFSRHPTTPTFGAGESWDIALADLDGDGDLDAVVANAGGEAQTVWLNDGAGNFTLHPLQLYGVGGGESRALTLVDLDGDGDPDLVVANGNNQPQRVWINQDPAVVTSVAPAPNAVAANPAATISATYESLDPGAVNPARFRVWGEQSGRYAGTLSSPSANSVQFAPVTTFKPGERIHVTSSGELLAGNGDLSWPFVWQFRAATTAGTGRFVPHPTPSPFGDNHQELAVSFADINGNGHLDALSVYFFSGSQVKVWLNDGQGNFSPHSTTPSFGQNAGVIVLGDLDNDGDLDAIVGGSNVAGTTAPMTTWLNDGQGNFTPHPVAPAFGGAALPALLLGDLDGDGDLDLLASANTRTIWLNDGTGQFSLHPTTPTLAGGESRFVQLGDLDGDGDLDAVVGFTSGLRVWLNDGRGNLAPHPTTPVFGLNPSLGFTLADIDGDGDLDAIVARPSGHPAGVWVNDGRGNFALHPTHPNVGADYSYDIVAADLDGDGDLDLMILNDFSSNTIWLNNGQGQFTQIAANINQHLTPLYPPSSFSVGDIDGNGSLDIFLTRGEKIWLNQTELATTVYVDDDFKPEVAGWGVTHFATIPAAMDNVQPGGTVEVAAGVYTGNQAVNQNVTIRFTGDTDLMGNLTLSGGTVEAPPGTLKISGSLTQSGGVFHTGSGALNIAGDFIYTEGDFNADNSTVILAGGRNRTLSAPPLHNLLLTDGLVAYWPLDETSGNRAGDVSGRGRHGTLNGPTWAANDTSSRFANPGTLAFDGVDDYVTLPSATELGLTNRSFTVAARIFGNNLGSGDRTILGTDARTNNQGLHLVIRNGKPHMGFFGNDTTANATLSANRWYHLVWRYDLATGTQAIYIDGQLDRITSGRAPFQGTGTLFMGRWGGGNYFNGRIDDVRIYDRALSAADIMLLGTTRHPDVVMAADLIGYWPLDEGSGHTATDASGTGHTGTSSTGLPWSTDYPLSNFNNRHSLNLNGSSQHATLPSNSQLGMLTNNFTVAGWVRPTSLSGVRRILSSARSSGNRGWGFGLRDSGFRFTTYGIRDYDTTGVSIQPNVWTHVAAVMGSNNHVTFYVNGVAVQTVSGSAVAQTTTDPFLIGASTLVNSQNRHEFFAGGLDDLRVYRRVLSVEEISQLAAGYHLDSVTTILGAPLQLSGDLILNGGVLDVRSQQNHAVTIGGNFVRRGGIFSGHSGRVIFPPATLAAASVDGAQNGTHYVNVDNVTFHDFVVGAGASVIASGAVDLTGVCLNEGYLEETRAITGAGPVNFHLAVLTLDVVNPGTLTELRVEGYGHRHHPQATPALQTGNYWTLSPNSGAAGYQVSLSAKADFVPQPGAGLCRYTGEGWVCSPASIDPVIMVVTGHTITELAGDWAVGREGSPAQSFRIYLPLVSGQ